MEKWKRGLYVYDWKGQRSLKTTFGWKGFGGSGEGK
jgi:hypothetical protein